MERPKIETRSYVYVGGERVELQSLPPDFRHRIADDLAVRWFSALYPGVTFEVAKGRNERVTV